MPRGKGEGSVYKRAADGMWCASVELPSIDGKRRRKVIARKDKAAVVKEMLRLQVELAQLGDLPTNPKAGPKPRRKEAWSGAGSRRIL